MPITPLHLGLMAPVIHRTRSWPALVSFTLINAWIDQEAIIAWFSNEPFPSHAEPVHTLIGALTLALIVAVPGTLPGMRSFGWVAGAFFGGVSHIMLDALVHPDLHPFSPGSNPLYMGWVAEVSLLLVPFTVWLIVQCVSAAMTFARGRRLAEQRERKT